jgi:pyruvate, orthophosphate dikinase
VEIAYIGIRDAPDTLPSIDEVGSKAANLARLHRIGLRVPPAFVLPTGLCRELLSVDGRLPEGARSSLRQAIARLERATGGRFGGLAPLLVSVRSSPPVSMPGVLETVLDVGLNERAIRGLLRTTGNPSLTWDTARRFAQMFAETVSGCPAAPFDALLGAALESAEAQTVDELDPLTLRDLARDTAELARTSGSPLPDDPYVQLEAAVEAVFRSWSTPRAAEYRRLNGLDARAGTAVVVQAMVFGNGDGASGSGVGFTRDPSTGADELYIDFVFNAQGEDVVSGRHRVAESARLAGVLPSVDAELHRAKHALEAEFRDMQDFEFTVQSGELYFLQTRTGKRTPWAAVQIAADLVRRGIVPPAEALARLCPYDLEAIRRERLAPTAGARPIAVAVPAGLGVATGAIALDRDRARALAPAQAVILVRREITTDDLGGLTAAAGIVTALGGRTSHAAVVARQLGKVCLVGCTSLHIDETRRRCSFGGHAFAEGSVITLDGESGCVYAGAVPTVAERPEAALGDIRAWQRSSHGASGV